MGAWGTVQARALSESPAAREAYLLDRELDRAREAVEDADSAIARFEREHESEYRELLSRGERGELDRLDATWDVLENERRAAGELLAELELESAPDRTEAEA